MAEYTVYWNEWGKHLHYVGRTEAVNAREALKTVLAMRYQADLENEEIDVFEIEDGVWQMWLGNVEYVIKRK